MKNIEFLTKKEAMLIFGGSKAYDIGYKIGSFFGDLVDWYEGFADGFKSGFDSNK